METHINLNPFSGILPQRVRIFRIEKVTVVEKPVTNTFHAHV